MSSQVSPKSSAPHPPPPCSPTAFWAHLALALCLNHLFTSQTPLETGSSEIRPAYSAWYNAHLTRSLRFCAASRLFFGWRFFHLWFSLLVLVTSCLNTDLVVFSYSGSFNLCFSLVSTFQFVFLWGRRIDILRCIEAWVVFKRKFLGTRDGLGCSHLPTWGVAMPGRFPEQGGRETPACEGPAGCHGPGVGARVSWLLVQCF